MLVLTRKEGQSIIIGNNLITIKILENNNNLPVKIGIEAPTEISVHREEVFYKIQGNPVKKESIPREIKEPDNFFSNEDSFNK